MSKKTDLDQLALAVTETAVTTGNGPLSRAIGLASAVVALREALTPQIMRDIMALQGKAIGFRTDRDVMKDRNSGKYVPGSGYPEDVVRDVVIEAMSHQAHLVMNEVNIIGGRCYLTREYFQRKLNEAPGRGNWQIIHGLPEVIPGGARVESTVRWREPGQDWQEAKVVNPIKADDYSSQDQILGKAFRKAAAWLYTQVTGRAAPEGDAQDEAIDVTAKPAPTVSLLETPPTQSAAIAEPKVPAEPRITNAGALRSEFAGVVQICGATKLNAYLVEIGWIADTQSFRDLKDKQMADIVARKDAFIAKVLGEVEL